MARGTASAFQIYDEEFQGGWFEELDQFSDLWNEASNNTIILRSDPKVGDYEREAFFQELSGGMVEHRNTTSVSALTAAPLVTDEIVGVKVAWRTKNVEMNIDAFKKIGSSSADFSFLAGQMLAKGQSKYFIEQAITAVHAAITNPANDLVYDNTGGGTLTLTHEALLRGNDKLGDNMNAIRAYVARSNNFTDLAVQATADDVWDVGGMVINRGTIPTFGRPFIVTDSAALQDTTTTSTADTYHALGLTEGAVTLEVSEPPTVAFEGPLGGSENIFYRFQAEGAYNLKVKGFKWDVTNGAANPTAATLGTSTNWDLAISYAKHGPGMAVKAQ